MIRHCAAYAAAAVALTITGSAASGADDLDHAVEAYLTRSGLTGISLAIYDGMDMTTAVAGTLDGAESAKVTPDTRFYVASCGKSAVAATILAYVADGDIALDDPALPWVDDLAGISRLENIDAVTIRQLLNHTSGLNDYLDDDFVALSVAAGPQGVPVATALSHALGQPAYFAPGQGYEYSNTNYLLLGHILGRLDGSISAAIEDKILGPAGMSMTSVGIGTPTGNEARGRIDGIDFSTLAWASTYGDGPLVATAGDLALFAHALFGTNALIPSELVEEMITGTAAEPTYGLGMGIEEDELGVWYGHSGGFDGYEADFRYYPDLGVAIAYAANGASETEDDLIELLVESYVAD